MFFVKRADRPHEQISTEETPLSAWDWENWECLMKKSWYKFAFCHSVLLTSRQSGESLLTKMNWGSFIWRSLWIGTFLSTGWDVFGFEKQASKELDTPRMYNCMNVKKRAKESLEKSKSFVLTFRGWMKVENTHTQAKHLTHSQPQITHAAISDSPLRNPPRTNTSKR